MPVIRATDEQAADILAKHGFPAGTLQSVPFEGVVNAVWVTDKVAIRICKDTDYESDIYTEVAAVPTAVAAGVRTPPLLVFDADRDIFDGLVTIYDRVDGIPAGRADAISDAFCEELGRQLARLHSVTHCDDPSGWLDPSWEPSLAEAIQQRRDQLSQAELCFTLDVEESTRDLPPPPRRVFVHRDAHLMNVLQVKGEFSALLDFGDAGWGRPEEDLYMLRPHVQSRVLEAYRENTPEDEHLPERLRRLTVCAVLLDFNSTSEHPQQPRGRKALELLMQNTA